MSKVLFFLFQCALILFIGVAGFVTFHRADHMANPDKAFLMTIGFWGICFVTVCAFWMFFRTIGLRSRGPLLLANSIIVVVCWVIYELMF
jgi:hypothetical protein